MEIYAEITSGDAYRVWAACGAIRELHDRAELLRLASRIDEIRQATAGLDLGGMFRPNSTHLAFALRKLEFVRDGEGCLCGLYATDDMCSPEREAAAGWIRIEETVHAEGGWIDHYTCECTRCGARYRVDEREYHYTGWAWKPV